MVGGGTEAKFTHPRGGAGGSSSGSGAPPTPLTEALEQAEMLRRELNKVNTCMLCRGIVVSMWCRGILLSYQSY